MQIDYGQFIHALSDTIDLVGVDEMQHGKRVGFMAAACADIMGESSDRKLFLYRAGLLHDCGVSSTNVHKNLVNELEWEGADIHCRIGADRMELFSPLREFSPVIRYHHCRWSELEKKDIPTQVKRDANLIFLLDRIDALAAIEANPNRLASKDKILAKLVKLRSTYFEPELVDALLEAAVKEAFWITQEPLFLSEYIGKKKQRQDPIRMGHGQLRDMARIFAQIVDAKSTFTAEHSDGVSCLAGYLATKCGLPEETICKVEVAGLLHDLGKLQVPDTILDFNGGLEGESLSVMRHHSYVTYAILSPISGLQEIARWAADHHEKIDGSGYPFKRRADELSVESRIIMVADIFQALAQDRPYRSAMPQADILELLTRQAADNKLDRELVNIVSSEQDECYQRAKCMEN